MPLNENLASILVHHQKYASLIRFRQNLQFRMFQNILFPVFRVTGMRAVKIIIETTDQRDLPVQKTMSVNAGKLCLSLMFLNSIMIIESRLHTPADMKRRGHMRLAPLHDLRQLVPVVDLLKLHILHRRAGNNHTIKALAADLVKRHIKLIQMRL